MRVLVVGGAGYIGAHICKALSERGDTPVVLDNLSRGHRHAVKWGPLIETDVRDVNAVENALTRHQIDAVMHFAANIEVGEGERDPLTFWDNNVGGVIALLQAMKRAGVKPLVFSSTCAVYGQPDTLPISESEPRTPVNVYGRTKHVVELMLEDVSRLGELSYAALRYFNAAGASPDGEIGEEHDPETHLVPNALKAAAGLGGPMHLFGDDYATPDGSCIRDFIHVMDLAQAHLKALDRLMSGAPSFACNLGTGSGISVKEILNAVERVTGMAVPHTISPRRPGDAEQLISDTRLARELLDFQPQLSTADAIISHAWAFHAPRWRHSDADTVSGPA